MRRKAFIIANTRPILHQYDRGEITFIRMVELLNETADEYYMGDYNMSLTSCQQWIDWLHRRIPIFKKDSIHTRWLAIALNGFKNSKHP